MRENVKYNILIVDDEKTNLDVLNHILKSEYTIYVAKTGEMALKKATAQSLDLILLDIIMPDMSGYDVLRELKENDATRNIPVIFITGLASVADEEKGFLLGAVDYITKPFNNSIVKSRIRNHLKIVQQMRTIERMGKIDALTEIPNRRGFDERISVEWSRAVREENFISILSIDADRFKQYNDTYGHLQGDVLLQTLAKVFVFVLKRATDFVARVGGEEFVVILPGTELEGAIKIAEEIRQGVEMMEVPSIGVSVANTTVSIGVATTKPEKDDSYMDLLEEADKELYRAKNQGRNRVCSKEAGR